MSPDLLDSLESTGSSGPRSGATSPGVAATATAAMTGSERAACRGLPSCPMRESPVAGLRPHQLDRDLCFTAVDGAGEAGGKCGEGLPVDFVRFSAFRTNELEAATRDKGPVFEHELDRILPTLTPVPAGEDITDIPETSDGHGSRL